MFPVSLQECLFCAVVAAALYSLRFSSRKKLPLPPGPRKLPIIGNALNFPSSFEWETFHRWGKEYDSDVLHLSVFGTSVIILNSAKAAKDLIEKRSSIYSNRPKFTLINKLMRFDWLLPFMPYGAAWKERRRVLQRYFHPSNGAIYKPLVMRYIRNFLLQLLEKPDDYLTQARHAVGASLISMTYGTKVDPAGDPTIVLLEKVGEFLGDSATPMSILFDIMPFLVPVVSPFLSAPIFKHTKAERQELILTFRDEPVYNVRRLKAEGLGEPSFVFNSLDELSNAQQNGKELDIIKDVAAVVFIGGAGTTTAVLHTFFLAMTLFPEAQAKAQEELDRVVGRGRLPDFDDEPHLPYVTALIKEVHRWKTTGPFGIPRLLEKDDEYNGYLIPAGSIVMANVWAMLYDDMEFPEPINFLPERFLKDGLTNRDVRDPASLLFGFGRRVCPGVHIAQPLVWIAISSILSAFEISAPLNANGEKVIPSGEFHSSMTLQPVPFKCSIKPRHEKAEVLIRAYTAL